MIKNLVLVSLTILAMALGATAWQAINSDSGAGIIHVIMLLACGYLIHWIVSLVCAD